MPRGEVESRTRTARRAQASDPARAEHHLPNRSAGTCLGTRRADKHSGTYSNNWSTASKLRLSTSSAVISNRHGLTRLSVPHLDCAVRLHRSHGIHRVSGHQMGVGPAQRLSLEEKTTFDSSVSPSTPLPPLAAKTDISRRSSLPIKACAQAVRQSIEILSAVHARPARRALSGTVAGNFSRRTSSVSPAVGI
jgi:hypothetical protein